MSTTALFYCGLLSLQFGLQPLLSSKFQDPSISKVSVVFITECAKIVIGIICLYMESKSVRDGIKKEWSLRNSISIAGAPAILFAIQNLVIQEAFVRLDSLTFNLINQTKVKYLDYTGL